LAWNGLYAILVAQWFAGLLFGFRRYKFASVLH